jgi:hypothetical protein
MKLKHFDSDSVEDLERATAGTYYGLPFAEGPGDDSYASNHNGKSGRKQKPSGRGINGSVKMYSESIVFDERADDT